MGYKPKHVVSEHQNLLREWDYEKNNALGYDPNTLGEASHTKAWWKCEVGHSWDAMIANRVKHNRGCPYCSHQRPIPGETDLASQYPEIAKQWHPTKNKVGPSEVMPRTHKKAWWICEKGHEWEAVIGSRISGVGCPYCANKKVLKGYNDLATIDPELAKEWHPSKNGSLTAADVTPASGVKVWWICPYGHEYQTQVCSRKAGSGCPKCSDMLRTSFPEQAIYYYIKQEFPDAINSYRDIFKSSMELDIYVPSLKVGIEYDGRLYHTSKDIQLRDARKYKICKENGIFLIRIREMSDSTLILMADRKIEIPDASDKYLNWAINNLCYHLGRIVMPDVQRDRKQIFDYLTARKTSLASEYPEIAIEWDYEANSPLVPENLPPHSNERVAWKCKVCGNKWYAAIGDRTGEDKNGCPECAAMRGAKKLVQTMVKEKGSLASQHPELLKEWGYSRNLDTSPEEVTPRSGIKVAWICSKCGHRWDSTIDHRVSGRGCPYCARKAVVTGKNDLATLHPELMREWDFQKNTLDPTAVAEHSGKKAFWICSTCGNQWEATIASRSSGHGCSKCGHRKKRPHKKREQGS